MELFSVIFNREWQQWLLLSESAPVVLLIMCPTQLQQVVLFYTEMFIEDIDQIENLMFNITVCKWESENKCGT